MARTRKAPPHRGLSRRESEIVDVIYRQGGATALQVFDSLGGRLSLASVRKLIRILEEKGHLRHVRRGREFEYRPTRRKKEAGRSAAVHLLDTFFAGSAPQAVAALFDAARDRLSEDDLDELAALVEEARREGR